MGHHDVQATFDGSMSKEDIRSRIESNKRDRDDEWHYFDGGIDFLSQTFPDYNAAWEFLSNKVQSYQNAKAVQFKEADRAALKTPAYEKLVRKVHEAKTALDQATMKEKARVLQGKSPFLKCGGCNSKLSRPHMKVAICPVCHAELLSESQKKRIAKLADKVKVVQDKLNVLVQALTEKHGKTKWLVMGMYHS